MAIIIGYQGIGKSTLAKKDPKYIDLESSNFFVNGERDRDWYRIYCKIARSLSDQGYTVFTSSHYDVQSQLFAFANEVPVYVCYPALGLKDAWVKKLKDRFIETETEKDYKAWANAKEMYENNISVLGDSIYRDIVIRSMDYDLQELIENR